jgi:hypothetical protein
MNKANRPAAFTHWFGKAGSFGARFIFIGSSDGSAPLSSLLWSPLRCDSSVKGKARRITLVDGVALRLYDPRVAGPTHSGPGK